MMSRGRGRQGSGLPSPASLWVAVNADTLHFQLYKMVMSIFPNFLKCLGIVNFRNTLKMHWLP